MNTFYPVCSGSRLIEFVSSIPLGLQGFGVEHLVVKVDWIPFNRLLIGFEVN